MPVNRTDSRTLQQQVFNNVEPGSTVYIYDHGTYQDLGRLVYRRNSVRHSVREYLHGQAHANGIESSEAMLKRGYHGTHQRITEKQLDRNDQEFAGRQRRRDLGTVAQLTLIADTMDERRSTFQQLICLTKFNLRVASELGFMRALTAREGMRIECRDKLLQ